MNYLPRKDGNLILWLANYKNQIAIDGTTLGLSAAEITAQQVLCDDMSKALTELQTKRDEVKSALAARDETAEKSLGELRSDIGRLKKSATYTQSIGERLGIVGGNVEFDPNTFKTVLKVDIVGTAVRVRFVKGGTDGVNIYHRKKGEANWAFLARDTNSPYFDNIHLSVPNQPEHWEYRAFGIVDDVEIGLPSDIVEIVFGG